MPARLSSPEVNCNSESFVTSQAYNYTGHTFAAPLHTLNRGRIGPISSCVLMTPNAAKMVALSCCHIQHILIPWQQQQSAVILSAQHGSMSMPRSMPGDRRMQEAPDMHCRPCATSFPHMLPAQNIIIKTTCRQ